jgi:alanine dehydrogenase
VLLSGVPGVAPGRVVVIGGGVAGANAAKMAVGLGANVTILDRSTARLIQLDDLFGGRITTLYSTADAVAKTVAGADVVIGSVLVPGAKAPKLVTRDHVKLMKKGSVLVDIAIDQGGCFETSRPTTHAQPTFVVDGLIHYCVTNMPGAVARTSTEALNNVTLPFVLALAGKGVTRALAEDPHLAHGLNVADGAIRHPAVAEALGLPFTPPLLHAAA